MKINLSHLAPVGFPYKQEIKLFLFFLGTSTGLSFGFLYRFFGARDGLYEYTLTGERVLIAGAKMPLFSALLHNALIGFFLVGLLAFFAVIYHYQYHRQGSKSIYLMRRLPDKWNLHKRCFTIPLLFLAVSLLCALILYTLYLFLYLTFTPDGCLPYSYLGVLRSVNLC